MYCPLDDQVRQDDPLGEFAYAVLLNLPLDRTRAHVTQVEPWTDQRYTHTGWQKQETQEVLDVRMGKINL